MRRQRLVITPTFTAAAAASSRQMGRGVAPAAVPRCGCGQSLCRDHKRQRHVLLEQRAGASHQLLRADLHLRPLRSRAAAHDGREALLPRADFLVGLGAEVDEVDLDEDEDESDGDEEDEDAFVQAEAREADDDDDDA